MRTHPRSNRREPQGLIRWLTAAAMALAVAPACRADRAWSELPGRSPAKRVPAAMAYDDWRHVAVLYGGFWGTDGVAGSTETEAGPSGHYQDTWLFDGARWKRVSRQGPPPREASGMAFDRRRGVVVLFGGYNQAPSEAWGDTWEFDGRSWKRVATSGPEPRYRPSMVFDESRGEVVMFGGKGWIGPFPGGETVLFDDLWTWDGSEWRQVLHRGPRPRERAGAAIAYDRRREMILIHGGEGPLLQNLSDTWIWDGERWSDVTPPFRLGERYGAGALYYDEAADRMVMLGTESVEWDGERWRRTPHLDQDVPGGAVYDRDRRTLVAFGGMHFFFPEECRPEHCPPPMQAFLSDTWLLRPAVHGDSGDYDGDGEADPTVFDPRTGRWKIRGGRSVRFKTAGGIPVPGDYDGDGETDPAFFVADGGVWKVRRQRRVDGLGQPGDLPAPADYDGDGETDPAVFRPEEGVWEIEDRKGTVAARLAAYSPRRTGPSGRAVRVAFGELGDLPVPADYDGDGAADRAVYRPGKRQFLVQGGKRKRVGPSGAIPVPADYDGDGAAEQAVWDPRTGKWTIVGRPAVFHGEPGDVPVPADYDGDGRVDPAVYVPAEGRWRVHGLFEVEWGAPGEIPVTAGR